MTNYTWIGSISTSASTAGNWSPSGVPAAGDVVIFDSNATQNCSWDIPLPPSALTLSVDEIIIEDSFNYTFSLTNSARIKGMFNNGDITGTSSLEFIHGASPNFFGSYKNYDERFLMIGDSGTFGSITINMYGSISPITKFDDGLYPTTTLHQGNFAPDYKTPTGTSGKASFISLTILSGVGFEPDASLTDIERLKVFSFLAFSIASTSIDFGLSTVEFYATVGGFAIPTYGATGMPSGFQAYYRKIILKTNTAGWKCLMNDNTFISVEEFEIDDGVVLKGAVDATSQGCEIRSIKTPKIRGTWSFSQVSQGVYRSPRHAAGPIDLVNGNVHITGKLTVDGLIDPTGMVFTPQASNPELTNPQDTIYINSEDGHLYRGLRDVESTVHFNVRNDEAFTIPLGAPLYSKGEIGGSNRILVGIADASDPNKMPCIGLAMQEMDTSATKDGNMILSGIFNQNITITSVVVEDTIYVAPHGGVAPYLTKTRPTSGSHLVQNIGICVRNSTPNTCKGMVVSAIGRSNDIPNATITTNSADADYVYIDDGNVFKKITPANLGIGGGGGTVTSVDMSVPTGFTISGNPITSTGTLALAFDTGYALPTSAKQTQWDTAYGWGDHATAGYLTSVSPITLDTGNNRVGINEASPDYDLHVHGAGNYTVKFEHGEGQTLFNRYGHIQVQNDNTFPYDGATLDNPVWQIGQRDGGQFDIAFGNIIAGYLVAASDKLLELKRVGNSATGDKQIGFLGATAVSQQTIQDPTALGFNPVGATPNEIALNDSIMQIIAALQAYGLAV